MTIPVSSFNLFATTPVAATGFKTTAAYTPFAATGYVVTKRTLLCESTIVQTNYRLKSVNILHDMSRLGSKN